MKERWSSRSGREPTEARSPLKLRRILAWFGLVFGQAVALVAWLLFEPSLAWLGVVGLVIAATAAIDLAVLGRRRP